MAKKKTSKSRSKPAAKGLHKDLGESPAIKLLVALTSLQNAFGMTSSLQRFIEQRKRSAQTRDMLDQVLIDSINARAQTGLPLDEALEEMRATTDEAKPDSSPGFSEGLAIMVKEGIQHCESVRRALRLKGGMVLDAVLEPNSKGQRRSLEAHTKVKQTERAFESVLIGLSHPTIVLDGDVAEIIELAEWFQSLRDELSAVLELHGVDPIVNDEGLREGTGGQRKSVGSGMKVEDAIPLLEAHVKAHGGAYPSYSKLAEIIGCSRSTVRKATAKSSYLKARKAEAAAPRIKIPREVQLGISLDEIEPAYSGEAELELLISEQATDRNREERQYWRAKRSQQRE
jgi:hypothetical protein